ncbi:hypothetical protein F4678DRAFT_429841 [Xylaria arbuscula]|nr:hypothetical protein F4678DRAFT_429841 [Xylaria arbuscula]
MAVGLKMQSALVGGRKDEIILSDSVPVPQGPLRDHEIAVAVKAISLNPVDTKMLGEYNVENAVLGCDYAGEVTAVGAAAAQKWGFHVGDRVAAMVIGMNSLRPGIGAFAQHTVSPAWGAQIIPDGWSYAEAAGGIGGVAWITIPWALFHAMALPAGPLLEPLNSTFQPPTRLPNINIVTAHTENATKRPEHVLVSGGASYTGTCAIQLLKLAGFTVIATCSQRSFDSVRAFGADHVFDYNSETAADDIRALARNCLHFALDCITTPDTTKLCYAALGRSGGRYVAIDPYSEAVVSTRAVVHDDWVFGLEPLGDEIAWPAPHGRKPNPVAQDFLQKWHPTMKSLINRGLIRSHPQSIRDGGLAGALNGIEDIRQKRDGGKKLIYTL